MSDPDVLLQAGALRMALRPDVGGCISGLWWGDLPVLRSAPDPATARASACFPLVPYSNRIGFRRFRFGPRAYTLQPNVEAGAHNLHGVGWQRPWTLSDCGAHGATMTLEHQADDHWPFAFSATHTVRLDADAVQLGLEVTNRDAASAPMGLGWHPYFVKRERSRVHAELAGRWDTDPATQLPSRRVAQWALDADVEHLDLDHCFDGWSGAARIRDERLNLRLRASVDHLVVYTPPLQPFFCVEPVSHLSNALQQPDPTQHGVRVVASGQSLSAWMRLDIAPA